MPRSAARGGQKTPSYTSNADPGYVALPTDVVEWVAFAGIGFSNGTNSVMGGALWAELYGTASLGLVKDVSTACMVLSTALAQLSSPAPFQPT